MLEYPDSSLRDIGVSGFTGGSSSVLARKDSEAKELYVPLKKRLLEKSLSTSKLTNLFESSISHSLIDAKQQLVNIKKV